MKQVRHIVALGGGGFLMEPDDPRLDNYTLRLSGVRRPRVCFVPTASGDSERNIERFYAAFRGRRAVASHLPLFRREHDTRSLEEYLLGQHVIYVGGGNTANALALWRLHGIDRLLKRAWAAGTVLTGVSAGMICWFQGGVTDSFGRPLNALRDGLGFLHGSACPHYDGESDRRGVFHRLVQRGPERGLPAGVAADDGAAIHYIGRRIARVVASRKGARAYSVRLVDRRIVETPFEVNYLQ
ncbi:MAG: peptidase E [Planctomycetes bacterium]|nr:peptidase E [Planctomycetota bacterium]